MGCLLPWGGCTAELFPLKWLGGPIPDPADKPINVTLNLTYREVDGTALTVDVYRPAGNAVLPAVIMIHGGAWHSVWPNYQLLDDWGRYFVRRGFVALNLRYRLAPEHQFPAPFLDVVAAIRWAKTGGASLGIDPECVVLFGNSAGAHLALLAALCDDPDDFGDAGDPTVNPRVHGVIACAGPTDLPRLYDYLTASGPFVGSDLLLTDFLGGTPAELPELYEAASPLSHVGPGKPPLLLVHATQDEFVPVQQSAELVAALAQYETPARLLLLEGGRHAVYLRQTNPLVRNSVLPEIEALLQSVQAGPFSVPAWPVARSRL